MSPESVVMVNVYSFVTDKESKLPGYQRFLNLFLLSMIIRTAICWKGKDQRHQNHLSNSLTRCTETRKRLRRLGSSPDLGVRLLDLVTSLQLKSN